ncbi:MAG: DUF1330 domain-containing protein [Candidatus Hydrogenedentota bacterium]
MPHVEGTKEQMVEFAKLEVEGPIHMLNMLRFKKDGGRETYAKYSANTVPLLQARGGKAVYRSVARKTVIGDETWDEIFIIEYPSKDAFFDMVTSDEYQKGVHLRMEALEDSRLVCMQTNEA